MQLYTVVFLVLILFVSLQESDAARGRGGGFRSRSNWSSRSKSKNHGGSSGGYVGYKSVGEVRRKFFDFKFAMLASLLVANIPQYIFG